MDTNGSARRQALPAPLGPIVVVLGLYVMYRALGLAQPLGFRPALIVAEAMLAAPGVGFLLLFGISVPVGLALRVLDRRTFVLSLATGASLWAASLGLLELQYVVWRPPAGYLEAFRRLHEMLRPSNPLDALVSATAIAIAPATFEEVLFRGIVLPSFRAALGAVGAVVTSAALFGAIHLDFAQSGAPVLYRVPFAFAVGIVLGALRLWTGALLPTILAHATLNTITLVATPLLDNPAEAVPDPRPALGLMLLLGGSAATAFLFRKYRDTTRG
jgi:membrane protease YdiL (CAAX protease family)